MSRLAELPPDQRAVLSLLLRQRKSYAEVAELLGIDEDAVYARAHAALAVLAPRQARELTAEQREDVGDYLLGQMTASERQSAREQLAGWPPARAWGQAIAGELAELSPEPLPEIPESSSEAAGPAGDAAAESPGPSHPAASSGSRSAGAVLLAAIVVVVVVAVVLIVNDSGGSSGSSSHNTGTRTSSATGSGTATAPRVDAQLNLTPPESSSKALGVAEVLSEGNQRAFYMVAQGLPATSGFRYVAWLYSSQRSFEALGVGPAVHSDGRMQAIGPLPADAGRYSHLILTRETSSRPTSPGPIVLSGPFRLH